MPEFLENEQDTKFVVDADSTDFMYIVFKPAWKEIEKDTGESTGRFIGAAERQISIESLPESIRVPLKAFIIDYLMDNSG